MDLDVIKQQEAVDVIERLLAPGANVSSWEEVSESCNLIHDNLLEDSEVEVLNRDTQVVDSVKRDFTASDYWQAAAARSETKMSTDELIKILDEKENSWHFDRLKTDYFGDQLSFFTKESIKHLLSMEIAWYSNERKGASKENAINDLYLCLGYELDSFVFNIIKTEVTAVWNNKKLRQQLALSAKDKPGKLGLRNMAILLREAGKQINAEVRLLPIALAIKGLGLSKQSLEFLFNTLPDYLDQVTDLRNKPQHRERDCSLIEKFQEVRGKALGIGGQSLMLQILKAKSESLRTKS